MHKNWTFHIWIKASTTQELCSFNSCIFVCGLNWKKIWEKKNFRGEVVRWKMQKLFTLPTCSEDEHGWPFPLIRRVSDVFLCCPVRWQSSSHRHQHPVPPGTDAGHPDPGGSGEGVWRDGTLHGVSPTSQDPGDSLHFGQGRCKAVMLW